MLMSVGLNRYAEATLELELQVVVKSGVGPGPPQGQYGF